jgi:hypothetical protein
MDNDERIGTAPSDQDQEIARVSKAVVGRRTVRLARRQQLLGQFDTELGKIDKELEDNSTALAPAYAELDEVTAFDATIE